MVSSLIGLQSEQQRKSVSTVPMDITWIASQNQLSVRRTVYASLCVCILRCLEANKQEKWYWLFVLLLFSGNSFFRQNPKNTPAICLISKTNWKSYWFRPDCSTGDRTYCKKYEGIIYFPFENSNRENSGPTSASERSNCWNWGVLAGLIHFQPNYIHLSLSSLR